MSKRVFVVTVVAVLITVGLAGCEERRGPDPTPASVAVDGPFAIAEAPLAATATHGSGVIYYPTDTSQGRFGLVAVAPGWLVDYTPLRWLGRRAATHGFVVVMINAINPQGDLPAQRGAQLNAALADVAANPTVKDRIDPRRLAVMGYSMGGGGSLEAAKTNPEIDAVVPLAPWNTDRTWPEVTQPTAIVGCEGDTIAPVADHAEPFYESLPGEKAYLEVNGENHGCVTVDHGSISTLVVSWLKRWVDRDTRYAPFLCPPPAPGGEVEEYRQTCPY